MANTKSAKKQARQNERHRLRNKAVRTRTRNAVKKARVALASGDSQMAAEATGHAVAQLDRAASKGIIHKNAASRSKSRLMRQLAVLQGK